jgi:hypothetical protein
MAVLFLPPPGTLFDSAMGKLLPAKLGKKIPITVHTTLVLLWCFLVVILSL